MRTGTVDNPVDHPTFYAWLFDVSKPDDVTVLKWPPGELPVPQFQQILTYGAPGNPAFKKRVTVIGLNELDRLVQVKVI